MTEFGKGDRVRIPGEFEVKRVLGSGRVLLQIVPMVEVALPAVCLGMVEKAKPVNKYLAACEGLLRPMPVPVLVRYNNNDEWKDRYLDGICEELYPFHTTDGYGWPQCIPFEGNEHLKGTTDEYDARVIDNGKRKG